MWTAHKFGPVQVWQSDRLAEGGGHNVALHVGDHPARVHTYRQALRRQLPQEPLWLHQVHGSRCVYAPNALYHEAADAAWSDHTCQPLAVMTADCLAVALWSERSVAVAHAGWRGLVAGVLEQTLAAMGGATQAWLSPCIGRECFEVGQEVLDAAVASDPGAESAFRPLGGGQYWADLPALAVRRLQAMHVEVINPRPPCTLCDPQRWYSHRGSGGRAGRLATLIWRDLIF